MAYTGEESTVVNSIKRVAAALQSYVVGFISQVAETLVAMDAAKADKPTRIPFTIDAAAWTMGSGVAGYPLYAVIEADITYEQDASIEFSPDTLAQLDVGIFPAGHTAWGEIRIYADGVPNIDLVGTYEIIEPLPPAEDIYIDDNTEPEVEDNGIS